MRLQEIADMLSGQIEGNPEAEITGVGKIESAGEKEITFISNPQYEKFYKTTKAGAIIISNGFKLKSKRDDISLIRVEDPYLSFLKLLEMFEAGNEKEPTGISEFCILGENAETGENIFIGNFVSIGNNFRIGNNSKIHSSCTLGNNVSIGENCLIYPNVTIYSNSMIGSNVIIHSGTVIGSDGFGFAKQEDGSYKKIPQTGNVVIEDNVEIGSNCSIDKATIGETKICKGVKLDNLIQVAHNVIIDENTVIAAQVGIAGSTKIGKRCVIGGQTGIAGHLTIGDDVTFGAKVGVVRSIDKPGIYAGYRARPLREALKSDAVLQYVEKLEAKIMKLEEKISSQT